jgi:two-component system, OmpR family, response regulator
MLTAKYGELDEPKHSTPADDYLTKPFSPSRAGRSPAGADASRRPRTSRGAGRRRAAHRPASRRCWRGDTAIPVTARELAVLEFLVRHAGQVVSKREILDHVWDDDFEGDPNIIDVYIRYLRKKIDLPFGRQAIETVRGSGYRLAADGG